MTSQPKRSSISPERLHNVLRIVQASFRACEPTLTARAVDADKIRITNGPVSNIYRIIPAPHGVQLVLLAN